MENGHSKLLDTPLLFWPQDVKCMGGFIPRIIPRLGCWTVRFRMRLPFRPCELMTNSTVSRLKSETFAGASPVRATNFCMLDKSRVSSTGSKPPF